MVAHPNDTCRYLKHAGYLKLLFSHFSISRNSWSVGMVETGEKGEIGEMGERQLQVQQEVPNKN